MESHISTRSVFFLRIIQWCNISSVNFSYALQRPFYLFIRMRTEIHQKFALLKCLSDVEGGEQEEEDLFIFDLHNKHFRPVHFVKRCFLNRKIEKPTNGSLKSKKDSNRSSSINPISVQLLNTKIREGQFVRGFFFFLFLAVWAWLRKSVNRWSDTSKKRRKNKSTTKRFRLINCN